MRISRIYIDHPIPSKGSIELEDKARHYLINVLRLRPNDRVILFNGNGSEYLGYLAESSTRSVLVSIEREHQPARESGLHIELGQGISRGERMDFVFQKAVELGVHTFSPLWTDRCQIHLSGARLEKRLAHWRGVINSACEQSGRVRIPVLNLPTQLDGWLRTGRDQLKIVLDPDASISFKEIPKTTNVRILIGPEGGLNADEISAAESSGFIAVRLGPRVLRTETAALAALAAIQTLWGDLTT